MSNDTRRIIVKKVTAGIPTFGIYSINNVIGSLNLLDSSDILITVDSSAGTFTFENTSTLDTVTGRGDSTSNSVTFGDITTTGRINGPSSLIIDPNGDNAVTGELRVLGDLRVDGTTTSVNSTEVSFNDKNIVLGDSATEASDLNGAGLTIGNDALFGGSPGSAPLFTYNYTNNRFELNRDLFVNDGISTDSANITVLTVDSGTFNRIKGEIHGLYIDSNSIENDRLVNSTITFSDGTDSQIVDLGETVTFNGGTDLTATVSPTNTVTFSHDPSGVTAGTYGSNVKIPVFTVDSQGHVTNVDSATISTTLSLVSDSDSGSVSLLDSSMSINEGEGINIDLSGTVFTVSGEDATVTNKGIASFDSTDFSVSSGAVSIKNSGVGNNQLENDTVTIGSTAIALGDSSDSLLGLSQVTTENLTVTDSATINQATVTTLDVTDSATITDLTVDSDANLAHVYVSDLTDNGIVISGTNGRLEDDSNFTFNGTQFDIGGGNFTVQQASGNTAIAGTLDVTDSSTFSTANITQANVTTLDVTDSATIVDANITGTATINQATVTTLDVIDSATIDDATVTGTATINQATVTTLDVTDSATIADLSVDSNANLTHVFVSDLTDNRIVISGPSGKLEDDANFTFNGTQFDIGGGNFTVQQASGNTQVIGTLDVDQQTTLASANVQDLTNDRLVVVGTNGELEDDANLTYNGSTLTVDNNTASTNSTNGALVVTGGVGIGGALNVGGNLEILGDFTVTGTTTTVDVQTLSVSDPLIHLADSNETADEVDIGFVAHYYDALLGGKQHTGLFRDATDDKYYLFAQYQDSALDSAPRSNVIDRTDSSFVLADFNAATIFADTFSGTVSADSITTTNLTATGTVNFAGATVSNGGTVTTVDINGGTIDGTTIGHTTPDSGTFTNLKATTVDINGGTIDGTTIDTSDITVGAGKTLNVSAGTLTLANDQISGDKVEGGTINAVTINNLTSGNVNIDGGFIDGTAIGHTTPDSGTFTNLARTSPAGVTAGEYGSVTEIPVFRVDASGFIDSISEVTIQDASTSNKGIASFDASDFVVTSGAVSLATDITIDSNLQVNTLTVTDSATIAGDLTVDTDTLHVDATTNRVGVGTTSLGAKLSIANVDGSASDTFSKLSIAGGSTGTNQIMKVNYTGDAGVMVLGYAGLTTDRIEFEGGKGGGGPIIKMFDGATQSVSLNGRLTQNSYFNTGGNVGIGTASPSEKLHVVGNVQIDSDLTVNRYINSSKLTTDNTGAHITGEIDLNNLASLQTDSATTSTLTTTSIAEFPVATYGGAKFVVTAFNTVTKNRHITELLITHDSATAVATEYGSVRTDSDLVSYDVDINNSNVRLLATANTTDSITYRVIETLLNA